MDGSSDEYAKSPDRPSNGGEMAGETSLNHEDVRVGYAAAVQMAVYDGQLSWQVTSIYVQFSFIMIAGAIVPSFVGSSDSKILALTGLLVSLAGIITTAMFGSMVTRIRTYEEYWVLKAAAFERLLDRTVDTIGGSNELSRNRSILVDDDRVEMSRFASVRSRLMLAALLLAFLLTFLGLLGLNIWRLAGTF